MDKYQCYGYDEKNPDGSLRCHCVVAVSSYAGKTVKGVAKCHPNDEWDWEKGKALAIARCNEKIALKRAHRATAKLNEARLELAEQLAAAMDHVIDMTNYFLDATADAADAGRYVEEILETM